MLFNPKWEPGTLASFIAFLETKDPSLFYNWRVAATCACGQYIRVSGWKPPRWSSEDDVPDYEPMVLLESIARGGWDHRSERERWTFGACLERALHAQEIGATDMIDYCAKMTDLYGPQRDFI